MSLVEQAIKKLQQSKAAAGLQTPSAPHERSAGAVVAPDRPAPAPRKVVAPDKIVEVNRVVLRAAGLLPPEHQERLIGDQYRQIKRPLIASAIGRGAPKVPNGHLIMSASALPGEGKTFTSINLALSLALEKDISVLLVDADVAKPHISKICGLEEEPGLLDLLADDTKDVESMILPTSVPGLSILPAGRRNEIATELLASVHMERIVEALGAHDPNRIVLLDSPPLLLTSESRALAAIVGQIVLVVRADVTPQQAVLDAISYLGENKAIGLVLNQCDVREQGYYGRAPYGDVPNG